MDDHTGPPGIGGFSAYWADFDDGSRWYASHLRPDLAREWTPEQLTLPALNCGYRCKESLFTGAPLAIAGNRPFWAHPECKAWCLNHA